MKPTLFQVLEKHREAVALPGEPLGVTHCAEHNIKLKPGSNPVYINAYKLPHSQRKLVQEMMRHAKTRGYSGIEFPMELPNIFGAQKGRHISPSHRLSAS